MSTNIDNNPWESNGKAVNIQPLATSNAATTQRGGANINLRKIFRVWPIAILTMAVGLFAAWLTLRYAVPIYQASMQVSLKDDLATTAAMPSGAFNIRDPFNDKMDMMKSPIVAMRVVEKLGLEYAAISEGQIKNKDLYGSLSWRFIDSNDNAREYRFTISSIQANTFEWQKNSLHGRAMFNVPFMISNDSLVVYTQTSFSSESVIRCVKHNQWSLAKNIAGRLDVSPQSKSNTVSISIVDEVPQRALDILGNITEAYDRTVIESKNKSLEQSISFIHDRLQPLERELDSIESEIVRFRAANKLIGGPEATAGFVTSTSEIDGGLAELQLQFELINMVQRYVNDPNTKDENISLVGLESGDLQNYIMNFQQIRRERDKIYETTKPNHPNRISIDEEFRKAKENINVQINNYKRALYVRQGNLEERLSILNQKLLSAPLKERELLAMQRQQKIKQELYVLLLERREEAAITLAGTISETSVLSPAETGGPISPKKTQYYAIGIGIGLLLPFAFAFGKEMLDHTISNKKQIQSGTAAPILGTVSLASTKAEQGQIIDSNDRSAVAEQIRSIRTNLSFYAADEKPQIILITSSYSGEGKTFISGNLARTFAMQGLKVALLEFDMRRPRLAANFGIKTTKGLSGALLGQYSFEEIVIPLETSPNLHIFPTGAIPPNPSELMTNARMKNLKSFIDERYDVVLIDTPPIELVSDAQLLVSWSNVTLMVVRYGFTPREQLVEINEWYTKGLLGKMAIVFNGIKESAQYGYGYSTRGYYGKYGGYNYYNASEKPRSSVSRFFNNIFKSKKNA